MKTRSFIVIRATNSMICFFIYDLFINVSFTSTFSDPSCYFLCFPKGSEKATFLLLMQTCFCMNIVAELNDCWGQLLCTCKPLSHNKANYSELTPPINSIYLNLHSFTSVYFLLTCHYFAFVMLVYVQCGHNNSTLNFICY